MVQCARAHWRHPRDSGAADVTFTGDVVWLSASLTSGRAMVACTAGARICVGRTTGAVGGLAGPSVGVAVWLAVLARIGC